MNLQLTSGTLFNPLNIAFLIVLAGIAIWALWGRDEPARRRQARVRTAAGVLTSIGIFGTFTGILIGLIGFNPDDIQGSVPALLEGMRTAFLSSVVGLGLALLIRFVDSSRATGEQAPVAGAMTIADLNTTLLGIDARLAEGFTSLRSETAQLRHAIGLKENSSLSGQLDQLQKAIGGEGDYTLLGQITRLRTEQRDALKDLAEKLEKFAEKVSELGSKALIDALSKVIEDFNANLTEQFGENFKHLNAAVEKLVLWQDNYRQHLEGLETRLKNVTGAIESVQTSIEGIADSVTPLPSVNERLLKVLAEVAAETDALEARLTKFAAMGEQAVQAIPVVEANIVRLTQGFSETVAEGLNTIQAAQMEHRESAVELQAAFEELRRHASELVAAQGEQHRTLQQSFADTMKTLENTLREMHAQSARQWQETLKEQVERQQDAVRQQLGNLNDTLDQQVTEALNRLSQHLLGLHSKLVEDYNPLLDSLRKVVESGRRGAQQ